MLIVPTLISVPELITIGLLVFGGCCSNVFMLEKLLALNQLAYSLSSAITFTQFVFVAATSYWENVDFVNSSWQQLFLRKRAIPIGNWIIYVMMFYTASSLNNMAWKFNITVPYHIIFRSSGTVINMLVGFVCAGKRYSYGQVMSSLLITVGTLIASFKPSHDDSTTDEKFYLGLLALVFAAVLSAFLGLFTEKIFARYGTHWKEALFYSHFLALPLFLTSANSIKDEFTAIWNSPDVVTLAGLTLPSQPLYLAMNVLTQYFCIRGVNALAAKTSSLTVTVVLLVRKFISLLLSVVVFGSRLTFKDTAGAALVFYGAFQYSFSRKRDKRKKQKDEEREDKKFDGKGEKGDENTENKVRRKGKEARKR